LAKTNRLAEGTWSVEVRRSSIPAYDLSREHVELLQKDRRGQLDARGLEAKGTAWIGRRRWNPQHVDGRR